ncbi:hypothetical protein C8E01_101524 [Pontibacter virosus]|uniref:Uncharacterized protein n=2 Tax=Pontibacter virosus TaxID=1765052 RepID=A0A2U1B697_9BACT|nr:hypothetical protein C8E01_101524 [Pontibacter virosus]
MTFEEYLIKKRINREAFAAEDPARYQAWESMYAQMHPNSFYVAVKMVLNNVRLRYHLREEDVPRPATTAAPRPAARRAAAPAGRTEAVPPTAVPETPTAIPVFPDVPQETSEEKPVTPAAAPKPRPVVRRPAALKPPVEGEETTSVDKSAEEATKPAVPRARPVIKRPAALAKSEDQTAKQELDANAIPDQAAALEAEATKPARLRPVIKRPAALQKPPQGEEQPAAEQPAEGIAPASDTTAEARKAPRPRPVIKRPTVLQKPVEEQQLDSGIEDKPAAETTPAGIGNSTQPIDEGAPKPPRPRPVMKRPAALSKPAASEERPEEEKPAEGEVIMPESNANVSLGNKAPSNASEGKTLTVAPISETQPAGEKPLENTPDTEPGTLSQAKPPRPRPIIKRPTPPAAAVPETDPSATEQQENSTAIDKTEVAPTGEAPIPEEQTEKPKPPRPRPIIRRPPPKTEE